MIVILAVVLAVYRLLRGRWPWESAAKQGGKWNRASETAARAQARAQAGVLLGVAEGASREQIIDAHRRLVAQVHPDRGGTGDLVHEANSARDLLLGELALQDRNRA